jgi:hypothetical protein
MVSPSRLDAARKVPDRNTRIQTMVEIMRDCAAAHGACQMVHLRAAGFTEAEIHAYADEARAILSGRPHAGRETISLGRKEGLVLVRKAQRVRRRLASRTNDLTKGARA